MGKQRKFKVGDIVRPAPNRGWPYGLMSNSLTVTLVDDFWVTVKWNEPHPRQTAEFNLNKNDFIFSEEAVIDQVLEKYLYEEK
jgi:hypothetical protein